MPAGRRSGGQRTETTSCGLKRSPGRATADPKEDGMEIPAPKRFGLETQKGDGLEVPVLRIFGLETLKEEGSGIPRPETLSFGLEDDCL